MSKHIGLFLGDDEALGRALRERIERDGSVHVEEVVVGPIGEHPITRWDAVVDRVSAGVVHYQCYLRAVKMAGAAVINDPLAVSQSDGVHALTVAARLGLDVVRAVLLPQKHYDGVPPGALCHLEYPFRWRQAIDYVGFPAILARATDGRPIARVRTAEELMAAYDACRQEALMLQQEPAGVSVSAVCVGTQVELVAADGAPRAHGPLEAESMRRAALAITRALALDINRVVIALDAGRPRVTSAFEPHPDLGSERLGRAADTVYDAIARRVVHRARAG
jgi:hypothetical protein